MYDVISRIAPFGVALSVLAGCAAAADEITVRAAPGPYKPFAVFMSDQHACGQIAHDQIAGANTPPPAAAAKLPAGADQAADDSLSPLDKAYADCMAIRGNQVWGYPKLTPVAPPPPPDTPPPPPPKS